MCLLLIEDTCDKFLPKDGKTFQPQHSFGGGYSLHFPPHCAGFWSTQYPG